MMKLPTDKTKTLVAVHGWSAVVLGLLLYAVVFTGTIAVLAHEIGHWYIGKRGTAPIFAQPVDANVRKAVASVDEKYRDEVSVFSSPLGNLLVWAHTHEKRDGGAMEDIGVLMEIEQKTGKEIARREGWAVDVFKEPARALERFLVDVHVRLYLPNPWGLLLTGVLGLAMMVAAVSGLIMHRHIFRDVFTLRRNKEKLAGARDEHTVASTWGLPFAFLLAFTGCFFSFAGSIGIPMLAMVAFGGDQQKMIETVIGVPRTEDKRSAEMANLDVILKDARERTKSSVESASIEHYGRIDANLTVALKAPDGTLASTILVYDGASGDFMTRKPQVGLTPSFGSMLLSIIGPLHFGNFAGIASKAVWVALGLSSCFMIATGFSLWLQRREASRGWERFGRIVWVVIYGLPLALAASAYGFFFSYPADNSVQITPLSFLAGAGAAVLVPLYVRDAVKVRVVLMALTAAAIFALPIMRVAAGGISWPEAISAGAADTMTIDFSLCLAGLICAWFAYTWHRQGVGATRGLEPAGTGRSR